MKGTATKRILIKVSGDLLDRDEVICLIRKKRAAGNDVVVLVGGGSAITAALKTTDPVYEPDFGPLGRRLYSPTHEAIRRQELLQNRAEMRSRLLAEGIRGVTVTIPYVKIAGIEVPVNADLLAVLALHTFDKVCICTLPERVEKKNRELEFLIRGFEDKIEIVAV